MTRPKAIAPEIDYPRLQPKQPHELTQVDHLPHFLQGGQRVFCFNAIDVVSRYPAGQVYEQRRAAEAAGFLIYVWQKLGVSQYTQVDNEACFSGGFTHPYVLGQCVRLALRVGTELVFSPVRHPKSNGSVERFHQDYQAHVWQDTYLPDCGAVQTQADHFFALYRQSPHHSALSGQTPQAVHHQPPPRPLEASFTRPMAKLPLYAGRIHFIRRLQPNGTVSVLNVAWQLPDFDPLKAVWVTVELAVHTFTLSIYDAAPDVPDRKRLVTYPFPLKEPVLSRPDLATVPSQADTPPQLTTTSPTGTTSLPLPPALALWRCLTSHISQRVVKSRQRLAQRISDTMY
jgi:hypothetical protein